MWPELEAVPTSRLYTWSGRLRAIEPIGHRLQSASREGLSQGEGHCQIGQGATSRQDLMQSLVDVHQDHSMLVFITKVTATMVYCYNDPV